LRNGSTSTIHLLGDIAGYYLEGASPGFGWIASGLTAPAGAQVNTMRLDDVDCPTVDVCYAVGNYSDNVGDGHALVATRLGGIWTTKGFGSSRLTSFGSADLDCASESFCAAIYSGYDQAGQYELTPQALVLQNGTWSLTYPGWGVHSVSCPAVGTCHAAGGVVFATYANGSWSSVPVPLPADADLSMEDPAFISDLSCWEARGCVAVGHYWPNEADPIGLIVRLSTSGAAAMKAFSPSESKYGYHLGAVSCWDAGQCAFTGSYVDSLDHEAISVGTVVGSTLKSLRPPVPADAVSADVGDTPFQLNLFDIECQAANQCDAVGVYTSSTGRRPLAESYRSGLWSVRETSGTPVGPGQLVSISCAENQHCTAVGVRESSPIAMSLPPTGAINSASLPSILGSDPRDAIAWAVSCPAPLGCVAVGVQGDTDSGGGDAVIFEQS
ncbi:hypothetical protein ACOCJ5_11835, partial [Knoellia sp. CPCC 206450]|uniref:hypothetical protein n=1 Tax=Knoellia tibetensis TaxID=3404798 RepID=UPI003B43B8F3